METIAYLDPKNYDSKLPVVRREAVRGVIFVDGKLLMISSKCDEVVFPGGGIQGQETDLMALKREIKEETGYNIIESSVKPIGNIIEHRKDRYEERIWHQENRYYFCDVDKATLSKTNYTPGELKRGLGVIYLSIPEAMQRKEEKFKLEGIQSWNERGYLILQYLQANKEG